MRQDGGGGPDGSLGQERALARETDDGFGDQIRMIVPEEGAAVSAHQIEHGLFGAVPVLVVQVIPFGLGIGLVQIHAAELFRQPRPHVGGVEFGGGNAGFARFLPFIGGDGSRAGNAGNHGSAFAFGSWSGEWNGGGGVTHSRAPW